jgi:hypothetical protein
MNLGTSVTIAAGAMALAMAGTARSQGNPFIDDAKAGAQLRSLYMQRDSPASTQESWGLGGWIWGRTGYWRDTVQLGATVYGTVPLHGPDGKGGLGVLRPDQSGFAALGEAYARFKYGGVHTATLYRQMIGSNPQKAAGVRGIQTDMNYLGTNDTRMAPYTYEALMFNGQAADNLWYQAGYVDGIKDRNASKFVSMSRFAGANKDTGLWNAGLQWQPLKDLWFQGFYYHVDDTIRITYLDADWVNRIDKDSYWRLAAQYTDQRSEGANLLGSFKTWNGALYGEYGWKWLTLYGAAGTTDEGAAIRNPYSFGPFYISQRIKTFSRAGEDALMLGTTFNLAPLGLNGFSFDFSIADGKHAIDAGTRAALPKWREYDYDLIYRFPKESVVPNMRIRLRYGTVREDFGTRTDRTDDTRVDLNWAVPFN